MADYTWPIFVGGQAALGLNVSQSGRYLTITVLRQRNASGLSYPSADGSVTVSVNGGASQGGASASNAFPASLALGTWYSAGLVNAVFDLGYAASSAHISVAWDYPTGSFASGSTSFDRAVTPFYGAPGAPTSVVATRVSDTSIGLAWTTNPTTNAPYSSQEVYRSENGGSPIDTAALSGAAATYTAATAANKKYTFLIQARNSGGQTNSAASNVILTTPAALATLSGGVVSGGIGLSLAPRPTPYTEAQIFVERTTNGGSTWTAVHTFAASDLSATAATTYTDTGAPTSGTVQYRATVKTNGGTQGTLSSEVTLSNVMTLNSVPLRPTNLAPSGLVDVASPILLSWQHSPSSDGAAQSSRHIQWQPAGINTPTDIVAGNSTAQTYAWTAPTGSVPPGQTIQWRVRTAGSQPGTYGAWSVWQNITLRSSLTVNVTDPSGTWEGGDIPVDWTAIESWGSASQVAYRIVMSTDTDTIYDSGTVTSASTTALIPAAVQSNLASYTITVTVTDNYGLTSLPDTTSIDTDFLTPAPVELEWSYDDDLGQLVLTPAFDAETSSALDDTVSWMLERSLDQGTWVTLGTFTGDAPVPDPFVRTGADSWYRTTGYSSLGVAGEQTVFTVPRADVKSRWGRIAYGDGFSTQVRFGWTQTVEADSGRASDVYDIEGLDFAAAVFGQQQSETFAVSGKLLYKTSPDAGGIPDSLTTASAIDMRTLGKTAGVCLFRDGDGEWWNCRITDMKVTPQGPTYAGQPDQAAVSFTIERVTA